MLTFCNCNCIQWNVDLNKCQGTGEIWSLYRGFFISKTSISPRHKFYPLAFIFSYLSVTCWRLFVISRNILRLRVWIVFVITTISLNQVSVPYPGILLSFWPGWWKSFFIPRTSLYRGSLNRSSTVIKITKQLVRLFCGLYNMEQGLGLNRFVHSTAFCAGGSKFVSQMWPQILLSTSFLSL